MSATRLHILMSCVRPQNIPKISEYILECDPHPFEIRWHILQQGPDPDPKGIRKVNEELDRIKDGWFWTASDDAQHSKSLFRRLGETIAANPECGVVVFSERRDHKEGPILHAHADNMRPCCVDGTQPIFRRDLIGDHRFDFDQYGDQCDGRFIQLIHQQHPDKFVFVDEVLMNFNSLQW